jgi:hypothetical protein
MRIDNEKELINEEIKKWMAERGRIGMGYANYQKSTNIPMGRSCITCKLSTELFIDSGTQRYDAT